ncbi:PREDICTED: uncharacterized protein LOC109464213 [Branchiostoma belcheri]|uniref:Uncharacterized protein LOC109464213 n=1 Tax=Branchiostoma belcheri TaxID=7741 RepID=A0A6P4XJJ5_BRABE|nr:PREDICTED: uncharacterized protein LOC109464213 [Branchiostoma belcheri]
MRKQEQLLQAAQPLILAGEGRADSPGHSAKYGSYTMMDLRTNRILASQLVQSNKVAGSNNMEKEGLIRTVTELWARNLQVATIVTDRHLQVAKWIRENMPGTQHLYDVWHIHGGHVELYPQCEHGPLRRQWIQRKVFKLMCCCLVVLVSNAEAERVFSCQNRIKTKTRALLGIDQLDRLIRLSYAKVPMAQFDFVGARDIYLEAPRRL